MRRIPLGIYEAHTTGQDEKLRKKLRGPRGVTPVPSLGEKRLKNAQKKGVGSCAPLAAECRGKTPINREGSP